jgi:hypothetical protein
MESDNAIRIARPTVVGRHVSRSGSYHGSDRVSLASTMSNEGDPDLHIYCESGCESVLPR